jgi:hypothetical protein
MNVEAATMTIPWIDARESYRAYRQTVKNKTATRDDLMLYRGLRALLRGAKVLDINKAIGQGGRDARGLPRLAVARADWESVICDGQWNDGRQVFRFSVQMWGRRRRGTVDVPASSFPVAEVPAPPTVRASCQVPLIPPAHRPAGPLTDYHLLFEAEWRKVPPADPLLLKKVDGPFFVVLAAWNLTPLEQAVLAARL